jgi:hypothetical protein
MRTTMKGLWMYWLRPLVYAFTWAVIASCVCHLCGASKDTSGWLIQVGAGLGFANGILALVLDNMDDEDERDEQLERIMRSR